MVTVMFWAGGAVAASTNLKSDVKLNVKNEFPFSL